MSAGGEEVTSPRTSHWSHWSQLRGHRLRKLAAPLKHPDTAEHSGALSRQCGEETRDSFVKLY